MTAHSLCLIASFLTDCGRAMLAVLVVQFNIRRQTVRAGLLRPAICQMAKRTDDLERSKLRKTDSTVGKGWGESLATHWTFN